MTIREAIAALVPAELVNKGTIVDIVSRLAADSGIEEGDEDEIPLFINVAFEVLSASFEDLDNKISIGISHGFSGTAQVEMLFGMVRVLEISTGKKRPSQALG